MDKEQRRKNIEKILYISKHPITGKDLAERFAVTRQVIVQDIALLRVGGTHIIATPQGYMIPRSSRTGLHAVVAVRHFEEGIRDELNAMVDCGASVIDVIVEHPLYGEMRGLLMLSSRLDVERFMTRVAESEARPLSVLTDGVHLHTLRVPDEEALSLIKAKLKSLDILAE